MSIERVREYFKENNIDSRIIEFEENTATVELAAKALKIDPDCIAKSLAFMCGEKPIIVVVSGSSLIDNHKYKSEFNVKAKMLKYDEVSELIGHKVGGVCPFAINDGVLVYLDESLKKHKFVYPACGSSNSAIKLSIDELEKLSNYVKWVDVCKDTNHE